MSLFTLSLELVYTRSLDSMNPMTRGKGDTRVRSASLGGRRQCSGLTPCLDRQARPPPKLAGGAPQSSVFSEDLGEYVTRPFPEIGEIFALYKILYICDIKRFILAGTLP